MTKDTHTPGPWVEFDGDICPASNVAGEVIATLYQDTSEANARLIAAAPDLLEALQTIHKCSNCASSRDIARAAIAKATK